MQHRKTVWGLVLAALLAAAAVFLLPAEPAQGPAAAPVGAAAEVGLPVEPAPDDIPVVTDADPDGETAQTLPEDGSYTARDDVALYLAAYGHLPPNFITKAEARVLGWQGGGLEAYAPGKCIGGDEFGNYEGILPDIPGRTYYECDIDTLGADSRGARRIVYSDDGNIYYTADHYETFTLMYGEDAP